MVAEFVSVREHQSLNNDYGCSFINEAATMVAHKDVLFPFEDARCNHDSLR